MRVVNFNINGARVPGRKSHEIQERSWHLLAAYGADLALIQEVELRAIPDWAKERWTIVTGEPAFLGDLQMGWGSAIAADKRLKLKACNELLSNSWVKLTYDYAVYGEIELPDGDPAIVVSVHAAAKRLPEYLQSMGKPGALTKEEAEAIAQPGDDAWAVDLFFAAIASCVKGKRFLAGGDWNNSRLFDINPELRKKGQPPFSAMFFTRALDAGWFDCHGDKNEEQSFFKPKSLPYQLDHMFCDFKTSEHLAQCSVRSDWFIPELSDHAPMVTDFWTSESQKK